MANPFLAITQMGVTEFWKSLQALETYGKAEKAGLDSDKLRLQNAYSATRKDTNAARAKANQAILQPLIHKNSELRLMYADLIGKFNQAVNSASDVLKKAGLKAPALSGLGEVATGTIVVGVVAVSLLGAAWAVAYSLHEQRAAQTSLISAALRVYNDPNATDAERAAAADTINKAGQKPPGVGDAFGFDKLMPIVGLLAAALIIPAVLQHVPRANPRRRRLRRHSRRYARAMA